MSTRRLFSLESDLPGPANQSSSEPLHNLNTKNKPRKHLPEDPKHRAQTSGAMCGVTYNLDAGRELSKPPPARIWLDSQKIARRHYREHPGGDEYCAVAAVLAHYSEQIRTRHRAEIVKRHVYSR